MATAADVLQSSDEREVGQTDGRMSLTLKIRRYNPEVSDEPWWDEFTVQMEPTDRLLDALHEVKWRHDGTLALRRSCAHGICGSDAMLINGRNALACKVLVQDVAPKATVEPIRGLPVLKDLIVDMEPFFEGYKSVLPFLVNDEGEPDKERRQSPEERARFDDTTKCILCAACTTSCPIFWGDDEYVGPGRHRERPPVHLRLARPRRPRAPEDPVGEDRRVPLPDHVQLHRRLPARHPGDEGDPRGQALHPVRPLLREPSPAYRSDVDLSYDREQTAKAYDAYGEQEWDRHETGADASGVVPHPPALPERSSSAAATASSRRGRRRGGSRWSSRGWARGSWSPISPPASSS